MTTKLALKIVATTLAILAAWWIGYSTGTDSTGYTHGTKTFGLDQAALLDNGTQLRITDIREETELFGKVTGITIQYNAGQNGHHPTGDQPTLTIDGGETLTPTDGIFTLTKQRLDEPLAPGLQKTITIGYDIPIHSLASAQLNIDGQLFAGDFTRRISNG